MTELKFLLLMGCGLAKSAATGKSTAMGARRAEASADERQAEAPRGGIT